MKVKDMNSKNYMHEITESAKTARVAWEVLKDLIDGKFYSEDPDKRSRFETAIESVETGLIALEFNVIKRASKSAPPESSEEEAQLMIKSRTVINDCLFYISVASIAQSQ